MTAARRRAALVTGATRRAGVGAAIARELARRGVDVALGSYRPYDDGMPWGADADEPERLVAELRDLGVAAAAFEIDLATTDGPRRLFDLAAGAVGPITILVNNAARSVATPIEELDATELDRHHAVNVRAAALLSAEFVRRFPGGAGRIVNLTSGQGREPLPTELAYAASKGAIEALTLSLSAAVGARGITVNAVDPGPTDTGWMDGEQRARLLAASPAGRLGTPEDAARVVGYLTSPEAEWITGQVVRSRGGL